MKKTLTVKAAMAIALALPLMAQAESQLTVGTGPAAAKLDFKIVVPRVLYLAVGTGNAALSTTATVDKVTFDYTNNGAAVGTGAAAATVTGAVVNVRLVGNGGQIALASTNTGALTNGVLGDPSIPWSEITATSSDAVNFPSPAPSAATVNPVLSSGKVTNRTATWTYAFANSAILPPGTYGDIVGQNSRVTYTATMP